ncbi:hypothetical protein Ancab_036726 [Ancistrocladus abbreviatus]
MQNYYGVYGVQQYSPYYTAGGSGAAGYFHNFYPYYSPLAQGSQTHGFGVQYPHMVQYPYLPQHFSSSSGVYSLPTSMPLPTTTTTGVICREMKTYAGVAVTAGMAASGSGPSQATGAAAAAASEQNTST